MAITSYKQGTEKVYMGVATDRTGMGTGGLFPGDKFVDTDDSKVYMWTGSAWLLVATLVTTGAPAICV
jgi:hypothetical protein